MFLDRLVRSGGMGASSRPERILTRSGFVERPRSWSTDRSSAFAGRRRMLRGYLVGSAAMLVIGAYQTGLSARLPELPLPGFILKRALKGAMETATDGLRKQVLKVKKGGT